MEDINSGLNAVRKAIESEVAASTVKYSEEDTTLDAAVLNGNEAIKINISTRWLLILILYLTTLLKLLTSHKDMKSENQMVSGFIGEDNEVLTLNLSI
jgi:hypothetical protein